MSVVLEEKREKRKEDVRLSSPKNVGDNIPSFREIVEGFSAMDKRIDAPFCYLQNTFVVRIHELVQRVGQIDPFLLAHIIPPQDRLDNGSAYNVHSAPILGSQPGVEDVVGWNGGLVGVVFWPPKGFLICQILTQNLYQTYQGKVLSFRLGPVKQGVCFV